MPRSARTAIISSSVSWSTRSPFTQIDAGVGLQQPGMSFRIVDFPEPLAPRMIFVWPVISVKLMSCSTTFSSNASDTWSNTTTGAPARRAPRSSSGDRGASAGIAINTSARSESA